jgi:hypothetical protein
MALPQSGPGEHSGGAVGLEEEPVSSVAMPAEALLLRPARHPDACPQPECVAYP